MHIPSSETRQSKWIMHRPLSELSTISSVQHADLVPREGYRQSTNPSTGQEAVFLSVRTLCRPLSNISGKSQKEKSP